MVGVGTVIAIADRNELRGEVIKVYDSFDDLVGNGLFFTNTDLEGVDELIHSEAEKERFAERHPELLKGRWFTVKIVNDLVLIHENYISTTIIDN